MAGKYQSIIYFIQQYKKKFLILLALTFAVSIFEVAQLAALLPILNRVLPNFTESTVPGLQYLERLIQIIPTRDPLVSAVIVFSIVVILRFALTFLGELLNQVYTADIVYETKEKIFNKLLSSRYQFFLDHKHGDLFFVTITASERVGAYLAYFVMGVVYLFSMFSIVFFLLCVNFAVTMTIAVIALVYYLVTREISIRVSYTGAKKRVDLTKEQHSIVQETLSGVKYFMVFGKQHVVHGWFQRSIAAYRKQFLRDNFWQVLLQKLPEPVLLLLASFAIIFLVVTIDSKIVAHSLNIIGVFFFAIQRLVPSLNKFGTSRIQVLAGIPNLEICQKFLTNPTETDSDGTKPFDGLRKSISLRDVDLSYAPETPILKKVNMEFYKGKMTAIVGESGSGKTSIVNLILRLYRCTGGNVLVDGHDLNDLKLNSFLARIGYVGQETFLYHGTIKDNISFFDSKYAEDDVIRAATMADAHEFIMSLPEKYDTIVGDRGMKLSGGQRQRLAIARALIRQPDILILDEATSNLDNISEQVVQKTINSIAKDYTIIVVAHKLATVMDADLIYVLDNGQVVEFGQHADLMEKKGKYHRLNFRASTN